METKKINDSTIAIKKTGSEDFVNYDFEFLTTQKVAVANDLANMISRHISEIEIAQANVDEVDLFLAECLKLEIN